MQRARSLATTHKAVLFTCFNAELAKWIREEMAADLAENGGKITASGNGCVKTPMGTHCNGGTERYTLTPLESCE